QAADLGLARPVPCPSGAQGVLIDVVVAEAQVEDVAGGVTHQAGDVGVDRVPGRSRARGTLVDLVTDKVESEDGVFFASLTRADALVRIWVGRPLTNCMTRPSVWRSYRTPPRRREFLDPRVEQGAQERGILVEGAVG